MTFPILVHRHPSPLPSADTTHLLPTLIRHHGLPSSRVLFFVFVFFPSVKRFFSPTECSIEGGHQTGFSSIPNPIPVPEGTPVATRCPNIPVGLPSEPVGLSLSGYESFEPGIGLGGLVPTPPTSQPPLPSRRSHLRSCSYLVFPGCELCDPSIGLGGLAPRLFGPTSTIPPLPLSEFVLFYSLVL